MNSALTIGTNTIFLECIFIFFYLFIFYFFSVSIWFSTSSCGSTKQTKYKHIVDLFYTGARVCIKCYYCIWWNLCANQHIHYLAIAGRYIFSYFHHFFRCFFIFFVILIHLNGMTVKDMVRAHSTQHTHHTYIEYKKSTQKKRKSKHKM